MGNLALRHKKDLSPFRRIAIGTWRRTYDPSVYGTMTVTVDRALEYIEAFRQRTGRRVTLTHLMAKVMAAALAKMPDANAVLRFNRLYLRQDIGVFFQVALRDEVTGEIDLSGTTVHHAERKSLLDVVEEFDASVEKVRKRKDAALEQSRSMFRWLPSLLLGVVLRVMSFLAYTLNLDLRRAGVPKDAFGSCMVTNIGSLGLDHAYVPIVPYSRVPLLIAMGAVGEEPVVENGQVVIRKRMKLNATFDHRILDGVHAATMARVVHEWFDDPFGHFDPIDSLPAATRTDVPSPEGAAGSAREAAV